MRRGTFTLVHRVVTPKAMSNELIASAPAEPGEEASRPVAIDPSLGKSPVLGESFSCPKPMDAESLRITG